ncbi:ATP-binding protein [Salinibacillus xinjiangensis]|uniref:histidine kinase n=1 Tax=Salinibacillus xinjiangensis TaxID=1229268 RepID=A0A6G1X3Z9_9BACI|nr:ATP-binding protein [Salinibacillus xinjiangensis]MRG85610.1 GHKL domain-containing protein [Salinibacillus xinjiangensis]
MGVGYTAIFANLLLIFLCQLIVSIVYNLKINGIHTKYQYKLSIFIASSIAIILCITFHTDIQTGYIYDLRHIPLLLGTLYGGPVVGVGLFLVQSIYRMFFGGVGLYLSLIVALLILLVSIVFYKRFLAINFWRKTLIGVTIIQIFPSFSYILMSIYQEPMFSYTEWIINSLILTSAVTLLIYFTEVVLNNVLLKEAVYHYKKTELVSHLAASIAHEVRNPVTTVRGFLQLLSIEEKDERKRWYFNTIFDELDKAENIIADYLYFAKPQEKQKKTIQIDREFEKMINVVTPLANRNQVQVLSELPPYFTSGVPQLFQQAFINIMKNAIEAMPNGGKLNIDTFEREYEFIIIIKDTGHGMSKEQISKLFQPYFSTKGEKGTGLGLVVVQHIIESMNGKIEVKSELGKGTSFLITLPKDLVSQITYHEVASG